MEVPWTDIEQSTDPLTERREHEIEESNTSSVFIVGMGWKQWKAMEATARALGPIKHQINDKSR